MDPKLFYAKLSEYAELKQVKVPKNGNLREADEPDEVWREGRIIQLSKDSNPTLNWEIKKVKPKIENCPDCGNTVIDRIIHHKLACNPLPHWRETCSNCHKTKNPENGKFELHCTQVSNHFIKLAKSNQPISSIKFKKPTK